MRSLFLPPLTALLTMIVLGACSGSDRKPSTSESLPASHEGGSNGGDGGRGDGPRTWCSSREAHDLCDDFDATTHDPWVAAETGSPGRPEGATVTTETATSPPHAFASSIARADVGTESARIRASVEAEGTESSAITFSFEVYPVAVGASPRLELASVSGFNIADLREYGVALVMAGTPPRLSLEIDEGDDGVSTHPLDVALPLSKWTRVTLEMVITIGAGLDGEPSTFAVRLGDEAAGSFSMRRHMPLNPFFTIGVGAAAPCEASTVFYDDVTYDLT